MGDWSAANQDPDSRADATYNLDKVLRFIDNVDDLKLSASHSRNGVLDGFSNHGYAIHPDSEASLLKAFSLRGYEALRGADTWAVASGVPLATGGTNYRPPARSRKVPVA